MNSATIARTYLHGSGIPLDPGTCLRPSPDGHIYATTDPNLADAFAFRNAVHEWQTKLAHRLVRSIDCGDSLSVRSAPLPARPKMTGWVLTVTTTEPAQVDPDFAIHPAQFVRFPGHAKVIVTGCRAGVVTSWRDQTRRTSPYSLNVDGHLPHYGNGYIRALQDWKDMGYIDADFIGLGPWFPMSQFRTVGKFLVLPDEDVHLIRVTRRATVLKLLPSSRGTNNAVAAAHYWR